MAWKERGLNKYPEIMLSDCRIDNIQLDCNDIKVDFLKDGFVIKNNTDNHYYHTGAAQLLLEKCDIDNISITIIKKERKTNRDYLEIIHDIEPTIFLDNINLKQWKFVLVEEFYSELGGLYIGRLIDKKKSFWCCIKINFKNLIYLWNDIKYSFPVN